jgi:hypothetical protein
MLPAFSMCTKAPRNAVELGVEEADGLGVESVLVIVKKKKTEMHSIKAISDVNKFCGTSQNIFRVHSWLFVP